MVMAEAYLFRAKIQTFRMKIGALISSGVVGAKDSWKKKGRFPPFRHDDIRLSQRLDRRANERTPTGNFAGHHQANRGHRTLEHIRLNEGHRRVRL